MINRDLSAFRIAAVAGATLVLAGCAAAARHDGDQQTLARYRQYAGDPIDHIGNVHGYGGLSALGANEVLFWSGSNQPYLITVNSPCEDLRFANSIGVTFNQAPDAIYTRFDSLTVSGWRCTIAEIRPIDYARLRFDRRVAAASTKKTE